VVPRSPEVVPVLGSQQHSLYRVIDVHRSRLLPQVLLIVCRRARLKLARRPRVLLMLPMSVGSVKSSLKDPTTHSIGLGDRQQMLLVCWTLESSAGDSAVSVLRNSISDTANC
jgi:hypothetical protein